MEDEAHISIIGLPASGKTTFLAALWHMVREVGAQTSLRFARLSTGHYDHLNALAKLWRAGKIQQRTQLSGLRTVGMRLTNAAGRTVEVTFPDIPGEDFSDMWETRELEEGLAPLLSARAIALIVNGDTIRFPHWIAERNALHEKVGIKPEPMQPVDWKPEQAPTQVKLVALLQFLMSRQLSVGPRRLAVLISCWDKVAAEEMSPEELLASKLPLLDQYLRNRRDPWDWRVWGLSAQGGDYEDPDDKDTHLAATAGLLELDRPSDRISVVDGSDDTTDITRPLDWLIS